MSRSKSCTYLEVSNNRGVVVDGLAVDCFPHAFAIKRQLLHGLLLGKIWPLVEELPWSLVLKPRHMEKPWWGTDVCRHGDQWSLGYLVKLNRGCK